MRAERNILPVDDGGNDEAVSQLQRRFHGIRQAVDDAVPDDQAVYDDFYGMLLFFSSAMSSESE